MASSIVSESEIFFTAFEPKMRNRFLMYIDGIPSYLLKRATKPSFTQEAKRLPHINITRKVKGKTEWNPIEIVLWDPIAPSGQQAVMEWVRLHHESVTGRDGYADFYKKDLIINELGPVGDKVSEWIIKGALIIEGNMGELDWSNDEPQDITLRVDYDFAILNY
jgi:hypothetical protein